MSAPKIIALSWGSSPIWLTLLLSIINYTITPLSTFVMFLPLLFAGASLSVLMVNGILNRVDL